MSTIQNSGTTKSYIATWLFSLLLGFFGADRFYLGKVGSGVAKLLSFGGFGIWWLVDLIIVIAGKARTKTGEVVSPSGKQQLIAVILTLVMLFAGGSSAANSKSSSAPADEQSSQSTVQENSEPTADVTTPTPTEEPTESPSAAPTPSETPNDTPAGLEAFAFHAHDGVDDLLGNLDDIRARVETRSYIRVGGNVIQILMNQSYLEGLVAPTKISEAWAKEIKQLAVTVDTLNDAASGFIAEQTTKADTLKAISNVVNQAKKLDAVASKIG